MYLGVSRSNSIGDFVESSSLGEVDRTMFTEEGEFFPLFFTK
jgi:hypothetical protein